MTSRSLVLVLWLVATVGVSGCCSGILGSAREAFDQGRYADASAEYEQVTVQALSTHERAQYELYSGLTQFSLGDLRSASVHLSAARRLLEDDPSVYTRAERGRLLSAWRSTGSMLGQPLPSL